MKSHKATSTKLQDSHVKAFRAMHKKGSSLESIQKWIKVNLDIDISISAVSKMLNKVTYRWVK